MEKREFEERRLKTVSIKQIEDAISKGLEGLLNVQLEINIKDMDFEPRDGAWLSDVTLLKVEVSKPLDMGKFLKN